VTAAVAIVLLLVGLPLLVFRIGGRSGGADRAAVAGDRPAGAARPRRAVAAPAGPRRPHRPGQGGPGDVPWVTVVLLLGGAVAVVVLRRRLRRALELNGGPPA
jgi:hypothetical protein